MRKGLPSLINRRFLRIKVFQGIYSYHRTENADLVKIEKDIFESINKVYDLYLYLIKLLMHVHRASKEIVEQNRNKKLPSREDLNPNLRFVQNRVLNALKDNVQLKQLMKLREIKWDEDHDDVRKIFKLFREDEAYQLYLIREDESLEIDKEIVIKLFREYLGVNEIIHSVLEEKDIYWQDDLPIAAITIIKTIQDLPEIETKNISILADLYKTKKEDQQFVKELLNKSITFGDDYSELVATHADNWETDRIALLDMILMKMALSELEHFPTIPIKVSLNEYIELAKVYSTPKSKVFINGVLDKLVAEMKGSKRINKSGRGLVE
ncbi:MAG: transcription antitermination protein NusB [Flavobacteriales bacterium]|jgi:transcription antitermination protein NusB|nr:transcription antitermination protein NusB [Flavobacteriales bacterium]NCG29657.1 transcription antitermination factor NusB [Bacteroidota bacterium]MBT3962699.1 transcription antitermination protein NusB [Flavobacteriales bacterium]MBT4705255.1 transcription antitermination protein NusB [Flavobacteriales bacterium]MBT4931300.1 transcription antitermination protein NusB [Flavobacteriales bacterium]